MSTGTQRAGSGGPKAKAVERSRSPREASSRELKRQRAGWLAAVTAALVMLPARANAAPRKPRKLGTEGLRGWIENNVLTVGVLVLAVMALFSGRKGDFSKIINIVACVFIAATLAAMATGTTLTDVGQFLVGLISTGGEKKK